MKSPNKIFFKINLEGNIFSIYLPKINQIQMDNLFLSALDDNQLKTIENIKANKAFALRIIQDLDVVFNTNFSIENQQNGVVIYIKVSASHNLYNCAKFVATTNGVKFSTSTLGYYRCKQFKDLGWLYEKYKGNGTTAENNFLSNHGHGYVNFKLPIKEHDVNLKETLKDIVYLMEQKGFIKRF